MEELPKKVQYIVAGVMKEMNTDEFLDDMRVFSEIRKIKREANEVAIAGGNEPPFPDHEL